MSIHNKIAALRSFLESEKSSAISKHFGKPTIQSDAIKTYDYHLYCLSEIEQWVKEREAR